MVGTVLFSTVFCVCASELCAQWYVVGLSQCVVFVVAVFCVVAGGS